MTVVLEDVRVRAGDVELGATLGIPDEPIGLVLFAHGSGSSRHSRRNQHVARILRERGLATLLLDLLTVEEERTDAIDASLRFDIDLLTERLIGATDWAQRDARLRALAIAYFGASTGAAAALRGAARRPEVVRAVVSRGGRPDLADDALADVRAPTLLIVGGDDRDVLALNRAAARRMGAPVRLAIVPGATHLFEEPGALDEVARVAGDWFVAKLGHAATDGDEATSLPFRDRRSAGRLLAARLAHHRDAGAIVLGLPRGGVPVADEVARALDAPLDAWICRKLGAPAQPELGLGAIAEGGGLVIDRELVADFAVSPARLRAIVHREVGEIRARRRRFRAGAPPPDVRGRTVIVVDDGIATGGTIRAALHAIRRCGAARIVVAVPVAAPESLALLAPEADEIVCLAAPDPLMAIGIWYADFRPVEDDEVVQILAAGRARAPRSEAARAAAPP